MKCPSYFRHDGPDPERPSGEISILALHFFGRILSASFSLTSQPVSRPAGRPAGRPTDSMHDFIALSAVPRGVLSLLPSDRSDLRPYARLFAGTACGTEKKNLYMHVRALLCDISKFIVQYGGAARQVILTFIRG